MSLLGGCAEQRPGAVNLTGAQKSTGRGSTGSNLPCQAEGEDSGGEGRSTEHRGLTGTPAPSSSACRFGASGVTFDTQHVPIQWKAPVLICFNGQGLPAVLNTDRKKAGSSVTASSSLKAFKDLGDAAPEQDNGSQPF